MMRTVHRFATSALAFAVAVSAWATHIIGGDMYYDHLGGNQYQVTLRLYRDCGPDNTNNTAFDASAQIAVFTANGALFTDVVVSDPGETVVPVTLNDPCLTAPPSVCVRTTVYIHTFTLPPTPGGYTISYQRCCRTPAMVNLSGQQGLTCTITIPGPPNNVNSSPRFNDYPPIALCLDQDMSFDHSATDPDGDQLVYGLCSPFQGADNINPAPLAGPPPYDPVNWAAGYSGANPINSAPPIAIDIAHRQAGMHSRANIMAQPGLGRVGGDFIPVQAVLIRHRQHFQAAIAIDIGAGDVVHAGELRIEHHACERHLRAARVAVPGPTRYEIDKAIAIHIHGDPAHIRG